MRDIVLREPKAKMLRSAATLAQELGQSGIVVFTRSGFLAYVLGALRPAWGTDLRIHRCGRDLPSTAPAMGGGTILDGVLRRSRTNDPGCVGYLQRKNWCAAGTRLVVITNVLAGDEIIDSMQLRQVEG